ncbi:MAG TPA: YugN family protein [Pseudogracilibacillus sp.]|nr:YugN family protein [Pseudogracilibacillus sp.]
MLVLESTPIEGKQAYFGDLRDAVREYGFSLCGGWDYHKGKFDSVIWREGGESIYLRMPFYVIDGELDRNDALLQFMTPYVIKHIVHVGLDRDGTSLLDATGFAQFQEPIDTDATIREKSKWEHVGEETVEMFVRELLH